SAGTGAEGTAILGIVHDLAPGASLLFASGVASPLAFDQAVNCLADAGAKVIVDDLQFFGEPYFEDGTVAQSVRAAVQRGVSFHSAAGNSGQLHYEGVFQPSPNSKFHNFNTSGGVDNTNGVLLPPGGSLLCVLQWDDPFGAAGDDYDLFLLDGASPPNVITPSQDVQNGPRPPLRIPAPTTPAAVPRWPTWPSSASRALRARWSSSARRTSSRWSTSRRRARSSVTPAFRRSSRSARSTSPIRGSTPWSSSARRGRHAS